jgi:serine/threonine protein phosphatase PrpC
MDKPRLRFAQATDTSSNHDINHDTSLALTMHSVSSFGTSDIGFFILAEGGGKNGSGVKAAALTMRTIAHEITSRLYQPSVSSSTHQSSDSVREMLTAAFQQANQALLDHYPNSFTSVTAVLVIDEKVHVASVGEIGVYLVTENEIEQLTKGDVVSALIQQGQITPGEFHELKTMPIDGVLHALGMIPDIQIDTAEHSLPRNSRLLLYKSGLPAWRISEVPETQNSIQQIVMHQPNLKRASELLIALARSQEAEDDVSVILVKATG